MRTYDHVLTFALEHPWGVTPTMLHTIATVLARHIGGVDISAEELSTVQAAALKRDELPRPTGGPVAVIPVRGVLVPRASMFSDISGATSYERLTALVETAVKDPEISAVVLDVDSPGGNVAGATEFARYLQSAREQKPIIAQAYHQMCSCAYWIGASCSEIVATPSAMVGSIGVMSIHDDLTAALEQQGVKRTVLFEGAHKVEGQGGMPLSDEARETIQAHLKRINEQFVGDVAKGRGVTASAVKSGYGDGHWFGAGDALKAGMIDRIGTLSETVTLAMKGRSPKPRRSATALAERAAFERDHFALHSL